jgi:hypothetical protein
MGVELLYKGLEIRRGGKTITQSENSRKMLERKVV